jgi:hypothetical protein
MNVLSPPLEGRPDTFKGAVGNFSFEADVSPRELKVGDPLTVRIKISGKGNFDTVTCPQLESSEGFKVYQPQIKQQDAEKTFEQIVIPESEHITQIPKIIFSFFDSETEEYKTITQGPFAVKVAKADVEGVKIVESPQAISRTIVKEHFGRDIVYIKNSPGRLRKQGVYLYKKKGFIFFHLVVFAMFVIAAIVYKEKEKLKSDVRYARRLGAPSKAKKGINQARRFLQQGRQFEFFNTVFKTLQEYIGDKFHLPSGGITLETVERVLRELQIKDDTIKKLKSIFDDCDTVRYAPSSEFDKKRQERIFVLMKEVIGELQRHKV